MLSKINSVFFSDKSDCGKYEDVTRIPLLQQHSTKLTDEESAIYPNETDISGDIHRDDADDSNVER